MANALAWDGIMIAVEPCPEGVKITMENEQERTILTLDRLAAIEFVNLIIRVIQEKK